MSDQWPPPQPNQQPWEQQPPPYGWQQQTLNPGQFQPQQPLPKKKRNRLWIILGIIGIAIVLFGVLGIFAANFLNSRNATVAQTAARTNTSTKVTQVVQSTISPTATPTETAAQYKPSTTSTTVTNLDKDGTADQGKNVHFIGTILYFLKDSAGVTAGANVTDPGSNFSPAIQITFPHGTDITRLNTGDTLEVWGYDQGVLNATNVFGTPVQVVGVAAIYMTDQTTHYQANT